MRFAFTAWIAAHILTVRFTEKASFIVQLSRLSSALEFSKEPEELVFEAARESVAEGTPKSMRNLIADSRNKRYFCRKTIDINANKTSP